ncbi:hypothetical protein ACEPAI_9038 [Sanghuangporus weigelae]
MSVKRMHSRRLSLFGLGPSQPLSSGEQTPRPNTTASFALSISSPAAKQVDGKPVAYEAQRAPIRRKLSKRRKPRQKNQELVPSPPASNYSHSNLQLSELSHESDVAYTNHTRSILKRKTSMNVRAALQSIFIPRPSRKSVAGMGIVGGRAVERHKEKGRKPYSYESRSPSPPSPEIRPPSGLGQIASSVDLSTYVQEEYEASLLHSLPGEDSRAASIVHFIPTPPSDDTTANGSLSINRTRSLKSESTGGELFYQPSSQPPSEPSEELVKVLDLAMPYFPPHSLSSVAVASPSFLRFARIALYTNVDSDDVGADEKRRRGVLQTITSNAELAGMVKSLRWVCTHAPISSSNSSLNIKRSIPRRMPTVSISLSPEEFVLPRVLAFLPNLETLVLLQPQRSILQSFIPSHHSSTRSPGVSPTSSPSQSLPSLLMSLRSLTLAGRTTVSTSFGSVLVHFLELHPGIRELNLPDMFCLPDVHSLSCQGSNSSSYSSSPVSTPGHELIPPGPALPPCYSSMMKNQEPLIPTLLPNLTRISAPLTLATQLVPGRPLRIVDIELSTSLYEGLRPAEVARSLAETRDIPIKNQSDGGKAVNWRAARHSRRFGTGSTLTSPLRMPTPMSPLPPTPSPGGETKFSNWKAARQARRAGITNAAEQKPSLRELTVRCTAKVDCRTIGRLLIALGKELGEVLEVLVIRWCGSESDLHTQLTLTLSRYCSLHRLEISVDRDSDSGSNPDISENKESDKTEADLQASIAAERNLVEQWSRMCPDLSHIEFASGRIWRAS